MKTKVELVNNWLLKADNDLKSAEHELTFEDAVTIRYPDDYYVPPLSEAQEAYELGFVG